MRGGAGAAARTRNAPAVALFALLAAGTGACLIPGAAAVDPPVPDLPFTRTVLDNGLTLVVHEDARAPIVAVSIWYHVGAKDEPPGHTGFAHLFEHLMFNGSEHQDTDWFVPLERVGATGVNGTTDWDVTRYFQTVPTTALDLVLWMESDRMGHLLGAVDQEKLDEQRAVVKNEKRDRENQPYGSVFSHIAENVHPAGHPYAHAVIGTLQDLDAARLEDAQDWFRAHYGAANAVLVVAGDVNTADVEARVRHYFGDIAPGPPRSRPERWVARRSEETRFVMQERVPFPRLYRVWNVAEIGHPDLAGLTLAGDVLARGKTSRLYQRLVRRERLATGVSASILPRELGSLFLLTVTARPGEDLARIERSLDEELDRFLSEGPTAAELDREQTWRRAGLLRRFERVGGFAGKAQVLAASELHYGSPDGWKIHVRRVQEATRASVGAAARSWLTSGAHTVEVRPFREARAAEPGVDRSEGAPGVGSLPAGRLTDRESFRLRNGLPVILARRSGVPLVELTLLLDTGFAADPVNRRGRARLAFSMLEEGTESLDAFTITERREGLGATLEARAAIDSSSVSMSILAENLDGSLGLLAELVRNPAFPEEALPRLREAQLDAIRRDQASPRSAALHVLPGLLFGADHVYGQPFSGTGSEASVESLERADLVAFHETCFRPGNATLVVVGDVSREELRARLEEHFGDWTGAKAEDPPPSLDEPDPEPALYVMDRPGAEHSVVLAAALLPSKHHPDDLALEAISDILGGAFTSRLNLNLREDKGWAYGASAQLVPARGPRPLLISTSVQTDRTGAAMAEILRELRGIVGERPPNAQELAKFKDHRTLTLPGRWETNGAVAADIAHRVRFGLPEDHWETYAAQVDGLTRAKVTAAAQRHLDPDTLVWLVVGDRTRILGQLTALGLGDPRLLDPAGAPLGTSAPGLER